jgi:acyl-CoA synthetase (AMP-forming)/AMP-acid ligase II
MKPLAFQLLAMAILRVGGTVVLLPQFSPDAFWRAYLQPPRTTLLALTPNLLAAVLQHPLAAEARTREPAVWLVGGDRTPPHLHARFHELTGGELVETCGMTETGPYAMNPPFGVKRVGSIGVPPIGVALRIVDAQENDVAPGEVGQASCGRRTRWSATGTTRWRATTCCATAGCGPGTWPDRTWRATSGWRDG